MFLLIAIMSDQVQGSIETCFVTSRLPHWSGVRQNVTGSDIYGLPVQPSNASRFQHQTAGATTAPKEPLFAATQLSETRITPVRALFNAAEPPAMNSAIEDVMDKLELIELKLETLETKLTQIIEFLNMP